MEQDTRIIIRDLKMDSKILQDWDNSRKAGTDSETHPSLMDVIYSSEVLKRLVNVSAQNTSKRVTLSRKRTMNFDAPSKVQCSYCCMQCINTDLKCEDCAESKIYVWYCTEECKLDHQEQHVRSCSKNKSDLVSEFRSFLKIN